MAGNPMWKDAEERILLRAIEAGLIGPAEVDAIAPLQDAETVTPWGPRVATLIRAGRLSRTVVEWLASWGGADEGSELPTAFAGGAGGIARTTPGTGADLKAEGCGDATEATSRRFGKYELGIILGQGGMGRVYMANDLVLKRPVALKFLLVEQGASLQRFFQEARAQARVDHEYVCRIYEAGEIDSTPYIAMQYVPGRSLAIAARDMTLEEKLAAMKKVAEGVHAAHVTGLIHRDLKPGNILVHHTEEGEWKPYVMDFGLARELLAEGVTASGVVMGTFAYMSPEQARGESRNLDRRSDVYGLGATMYEILAGAPPFSGSSGADVLLELMQKDPMRLRMIDPAIPTDVETITMKCLEKDPGRRYQSARALAEDLDRFLQGEPILARRATVPQRAWKRVRKYPVFSCFIAAAAVTILALAGVAVGASYRAREAARVMTEFGQEVNRVEAIMRFAYLLPLHDVSPEDAMVRARLKDIEGRMKQIGTIAMGPGDYALGRGYMALREYGEARTRLESAWNEHRYQAPVVAYALGLTLTHLYQNRLAEAQRITVKQEREAKLAALDREYREPAKSFLRSAGTSLESPQYVDALVALLDKDYPRALAMAGRAYKSLPWLYEARELEGDVYVAMANEQRDHGRNSEAAASYDRAEAAYKEALAKGSSDGSVYESLARLHLEAMRMHIYYAGDSPQVAFEKALSACDDALTAQPQSNNAYALRCSTLVRWGEYQMQQGKDPRAVFTAAVEAADAAVRLNPGDVQALSGKGAAWWRYGRYEAGLGIDPAASFEKAADAFTAALRSGPTAVTYANLGGLYWNRALEERTEDARNSQSLDKAVDALKKAIALSPVYGPAYNNLGLVYMQKGERAFEHGADPLPSLERGAENLQKGISLNASDAYAYSNLGGIWYIRGMFEAETGLDPHGSFSQALSAYGKARAINPNWPSPHNGIGGVLVQRAEYDLEAGHDPTADLTAALESLDRCLKIDPNSTEAYQDRGRAEVLKARWKMKTGTSPDPEFEAAKSALLKARSIDPAEQSYLESLAELYRRRAEWRLFRKESPEADIKLGMDALAQDLAISADSGTAHALEGALLLIRAQAAPSESSRCESGARAVKEIETAVGLNANLRSRYAALLATARTLCPTRAR